MALRFLADHFVSNPIVRTLRDASHEVVRLKDVLPSESPDSMVIAKAQEIDAILLSTNGDFADIVTYPPKNYKGIVALQVLPLAPRREPTIPVLKRPSALNLGQVTQTC